SAAQSHSHRCGWSLRPAHARRRLRDPRSGLALPPKYAEYDTTQLTRAPQRSMPSHAIRVMRTHWPSARWAGRCEQAIELAERELRCSPFDPTVTRFERLRATNDFSLSALESLGAAITSVAMSSTKRRDERVDFMPGHDPSSDIARHSELRCGNTLGCGVA